MKLADMIAEHYETSMTEEQLNNFRTSGNAKAVFNCLNFNYSDKCYSADADSILKFVAKYSKEFAADIAKKYSDVSNKYEMTEKQAWCIAFAFIKINQKLSYNNL